MQVLLIQTAFLGDAVLATALLEDLRLRYPEAQIDYLIRKGNEGLFEGHPFIRHLYIWNKKDGKYRDLLRLLKEIRRQHYDTVITSQRFASTGFLTAFSGARERIGFDKNPFSRWFTRKVPHRFTGHEVERNEALLNKDGAIGSSMPCLYPGKKHFDAIKVHQYRRYITIAPASVWFTKQYPKEKWIEFLNTIETPMVVHLIGAPADKAMAQEIIDQTKNARLRFHNLCGELALLDTAALMKGALMNYTNDSGPLHIASAMNAPVRAIFCSTVEEFGFGPLSTDGKIVQIEEPLYCRPCGIHGLKSCPERHFRCAMDIQLKQDWK